MIAVTKYLVVTIILSILAVDCVPISPCPMNFHYEYDGQEWIGVVKIYPQIYNRFRMNRITMNVTLVINRHLPNVHNFRLLQLYKSLPETYQDIAARKPILYRINFPFDDEFPELLKMHVNGLPICRNHMIFYIISQIELQYTFYLPSLDTNANESLDYEDNFKFNANKPKSDITNAMLEISEMQIDRTNEEKTMPKLTNQLDSNDCGTYDEQLKYTQLISGGEKVVPGTWPWLVAIFHKESKASNLIFLCSGNLISIRLILTAAHCFKLSIKLDAITAKRIVLAFGRHDIHDWTEKNMLISDASEIIIHPEYLNNNDANIFDADIALIISKDLITFNRWIRPICLWPSLIDNSFSIIGTNGTLVGWGQPYENLDSNVPRKLTLPFVQDRYCFPSGKIAKKGRVFCAGTAKRGYAPCDGDSGTAIAIWVNGAWFLRGIVSAALGDPILNRCDLNTYVIFTDITHFQSWIESYI